MQEEIKLGDVVRLKSGGPSMTVERENINSKEEFWCIWYEKERGEMVQKSFLKITLKKEVI